MTKMTTCRCADMGCPVHHGSNACLNPGEDTLYRVDMDDETGVLFCSACADDALDSGVFTTGWSDEEETDALDMRGCYVDGDDDEQSEA